MTDLDLTEALRVGTERLRLAGHEPADQLAGAVLLAAAPVIDRQACKRLAVKFEATAAGFPTSSESDFDRGYTAALDWAALLSRNGGETP